MNTYVIHRRSGWASPAELEKAAKRSAHVGQTEMRDRVRWVRSYITEEPDKRLSTVCVYEATDPEAIREHAKRAGLPCDSVAPVANTVIVGEDPRAAK